MFVLRTNNVQKNTTTLRRLSLDRTFINMTVEMLREATTMHFPRKTIGSIMGLKK